MGRAPDRASLRIKIKYRQMGQRLLLGQRSEEVQIREAQSQKESETKAWPSIKIQSAP